MCAVWNLMWDQTNLWVIDGWGMLKNPFISSFSTVLSFLFYFTFVSPSGCILTARQLKLQQWYFFFHVRPKTWWPVISSCYQFKASLWFEGPVWAGSASKPANPQRGDRKDIALVSAWLLLQRDQDTLKDKTNLKWKNEPKKKVDKVTGTKLQFLNILTIFNCIDKITYRYGTLKS